MAIHTGHYTTFDTISFIVCFIKSVAKGNLFLPEAGCFPFYLSLLSLHRFCLRVSSIAKHRLERYALDDA